jgi:hypothetical protein
MNTETYICLASRVARLERSCRRWRLVGALSALGFAGLVLCGAYVPPGDLSARRLAIVDDAGVERLSMDILDGVPNVMFYDRADKQRLMISVNRLGTPMIAFFDRDEATRLSLSLAKDDSPHLHMHDESGKRRVTLGVYREFGSALKLLDGAERMTAHLP